MEASIGWTLLSAAGNDSKSNEIHSNPVVAGGELKDGLNFRGPWECFLLNLAIDFGLFHMVRFSSPY